MRRASTRFAFAAAAVFSLLARAALAQDAPAAAPPPDKGWRLDVGAGVLAYPVFPGARADRVQPIPSIELHYGERFFASIREGVGYNLVRWKGLKAGPVANFAFPRHESDDRAALSGLGDVPFTLEAGGFVRYDLGQIADAKVEVRKGVNGHNGLIVDAAIDLNAPPLAGQRLFLSLGPRLSLYDQRYAQAYYGVTPLQAAQSGYAAFRPGGGYQLGVAAAGVYLASPRIALTTFGQYGRLMGDIANAPIVRGRYGARDQFTAGGSVTYRFNLGG